MYVYFILFIVDMVVVILNLVNNFFLSWQNVEHLSLAQTRFSMSSHYQYKTKTEVQVKVEGVTM